MRSSKGGDRAGKEVKALLFHNCTCGNQTPLHLKAMMKGILYCFIVLALSCTNAPHQRNNSKIYADSPYIILQSGIPDNEINLQANAFAKRYGVKFIQTGCTTGSIEYSRIKRFNDSVSKIIAAKQGENWRQRLQLQLDIAY